MERAMPGLNDPEIELRVPEKDVKEPEVSIVIPALNEEITIADFIQWCWEGLNKANVQLSTMRISPSTDHNAEIAPSLGDRVLKAPGRGLVRAYKWLRVFSCNRSMLISLLVRLSGLALYFRKGPLKNIGEVQ